MRCSLLHATDASVELESEGHSIQYDSRRILEKVKARGKYICSLSKTNRPRFRTQEAQWLQTCSFTWPMSTNWTPIYDDATMECLGPAVGLHYPDECSHIPRQVRTRLECRRKRPLAPEMVSEGVFERYWVKPEERARGTQPRHRPIPTTLTRSGRSIRDRAG